MHNETALNFLFSLYYSTPKHSKGFLKQHYRAIPFYTLQAMLARSYLTLFSQYLS